MRIRKKYDVALGVVILQYKKKIREQDNVCLNTGQSGVSSNNKKQLSKKFKQWQGFI